MNVPSVLPQLKEHDGQPWLIPEEINKKSPSSNFT
jgi:hypothetical protein